MSQKTTVDEAFREAPADFVGIDFRCEAACELGERLTEGAAIAIWPGECGRQRRPDVPKVKSHFHLLHYDQSSPKAISTGRALQ